MILLLDAIVQTSTHLKEAILKQLPIDDSTHLMRIQSLILLFEYFTSDRRKQHESQRSIYVSLTTNTYIRHCIYLTVALKFHDS